MVVRSKKVSFIHVLWMDGLFPLPKLVTLLHFQWLSALSVKIGLDRGLSLVHEPRLELPNLERLRLHMGFATDQRVDRPIFIVCRNLKVLNLQYALEYDLGNPLNNPATWMEFDIIDGLQELQIQLEIYVVNNLDLPADGWLLQYLWEQQEQQQFLRLQQIKQQGQLQLLQLQQMEQQERHLEWQMERQERQLEYQARLKHQTRQLERHRVSTQMWWRQWLNLPDHLENVQHSSLEVTLPPQMHEGIFVFIRDMVEEVLWSGLPQVMELTTSRFLRTFPEN